MIRGFVVAVGGAAVLATALSGCSNSTKSESKSPMESMSPSESVPMTMSSGAMTASAGAGTAKVTIDGKPKDMQGQVVCTNAGGNLSIAVGEATTGIAVMMAPDASTVNSVGLGNVDGVTLGYQAMAPGASATATKEGNTYKVTGTASGIDMANPMQPITKPFEIEVTCP